LTRVAAPDHRAVRRRNAVEAGGFVQTIKYERTNRIGDVTLTGGVTNPINRLFLREFAETLEAAANDADIRGLVIHSSNEKFFCIGLDIPELVDMDEPTFTEFYRAFNRVSLALYRFPKPTVAAIGGHAIAGGFILAVCCDYRLIASGRRLMGLNEVKLGVPIPFVGDCVLRDLVGARNARELAEVGEFHAPQRLLELGVVDRIVPPENLMTGAVGHIQALAEFPAEASAIIKRNRVERVEAEILARLEEKEAIFISRWFAPDTRERLEEAKARF